MMDLSTIMVRCNDIAKSHGWWNTSREDGTCIALIHSELSEALEAMREDKWDDVEEELADVCIRLFDYCIEKEIDLEGAIIRKMKINEGRPFRHGKKF